MVFQLSLLIKKNQQKSSTQKTLPVLEQKHKQRTAQTHGPLMLLNLYKRSETMNGRPSLISNIITIFGLEIPLDLKKKHKKN